jgi:ABC-2 type transport system ATP-binding protein
MGEVVPAAPHAAATASQDAGPALCTRGLTKRYGERVAVADLSLAVGRGEIYGFLGPNGAGKTTTIRMCLGLIAPTAGSVELLGCDVSISGARVLTRVGALVEQPAVYTYLSGRHNLRVVGDALGGVPPARLDAVLDLVGLRARADDRVSTYSLGMKQRLAVGLALLNDPDLLILDEPTNGLDPAGIVEMRDLLRRLAAEGKTIFISSHILAEVQQMCTRVAIIAAGRLVAESAVADLLRERDEFVVEVERPREALGHIAAQPWGNHAYLDAESRIVTPAPEGGSEALTLFLVNAGFVPRTIAPRQLDLEEVFLHLTASTSQPMTGASS